jgi:hypothetical protein
MKKKSFYLILLSVIFALSSCDTYPDYEIEYLPTYPLNGEYFVKNYNSNMERVVNYYKLTIYNTATAGKDSIWVDNKAGNGTGNFYKFKVKVKCDVDNRTFDQSDVADIQTEGLVVSLTNTKVFVNQWPVNDSIYMTVRYRTSLGTDSTFIIAGHRRTGFEDGTGYGQDM